MNVEFTDVKSKQELAATLDRRRELSQSTARFTIRGANVIAAHRQRR